MLARTCAKILHRNLDKEPDTYIMTNTQLRLLGVGALILLIVAVGVAAAVRLTRGPLWGAPAETPSPQVVTTGQPTLTLDPAAGHASTRVTVSGTNWPPDSMVILALEDAAGRSNVLAANTSDANGEIRTTFTYPITERWLHGAEQTVVAYTSDEAVAVQVPFALTPPEDVAAATSTATPPATPTSTPPAPIPNTVTSTALPSASATATEQPTALSTPTEMIFQGWRGDYWNNLNFEGAPALTRDDFTLQFDWGLSSPAHAVQDDNFSAQWTRTLDFAEGTYRFGMDVDGGARLYVDDQLVIDGWQGEERRVLTAKQGLRAGAHRVRVDYYATTGPAAIAVAWEREQPTTPTSTGTATGASANTATATATSTVVPTLASTATPTASPTPLPATLPPTLAPPTPVALAVRVSSDDDDAEQQIDGGVKLDSDELDMVEHEESGGAQMVGIRFASVDIPPGAIILGAAIQFTAEEAADRPTTLVFHGEAAGKSKKFAAKPNNIGERARTAASVTWADLPPWLTLGEPQLTPDLAPIVQEIVNREDWRAGNALTFLITGTGQRLAEAHDEHPELAPLLLVQYTLAE